MTRLKDFQNPARWIVRAACLTLSAAVLYACGSDDAPAAAASPTPVPTPAVVTAAAELINLSELNGVEPAAAGEGVAIAAVVRNLPDLAAGELAMKIASTRGIQLRDESGNVLSQTDAQTYLATLDLGRFGDGSFITHVLAGQSAGETADIPGILPGADDLDVYPLNYLADPTRSDTDYDEPVDFSDVQAMTTTVLNRVTSAASGRQIVLFPTPSSRWNSLPACFVLTALARRLMIPM